MRVAAAILSLALGQTSTSTCTEHLTACELHRITLRDAALRFRAQLDLCEAQRQLARTASTSLAADALREVEAPQPASTPTWVWPTIAATGVVAFVVGVLVAPHAR